MPVIPLNASERSMPGINFTCNSLKVKHMFAAVPMMLSGEGRRRLIKSFSAYFNVDAERLFLYGAGRMALYSFLKCLELKESDEVLLIGYTCVVVPNAARYLNMKIRYVDVSESTLNIDTEKLKKEITEDTKVLIIAHNFGLVYEDIPAIKEQYPDLIIIEDAAHALGSQDSEGRIAGTIGDASFFSFEFSKPITSGMGGLLILNESEYVSKLNEFYNQTAVWSFLDRIRIMKSLSIQLLTSGSLLPLRGLLVRVLKLFNLSYTTPEEELKGAKPSAYPLKMSDFQAAVLFNQMQDLTAVQKVKKNITDLYHKVFFESHVLKDYYNENAAYLRYPLIFKESISVKQIEDVKTALSEHGFQLGNWFDDVIYPKGSNRCGYKDRSCLVAESIAERIINLPVGIHNQLSEAQVNKMKDIIENNIR